MAREGSLSHSTCKCHHGQAAVLQLSCAHLLLTLLITGEEASEAVVTSNLQGVPLEDLLGTAQLHNAHPEQHLSIHSSGAKESIMGIDGHWHSLEGELLTRQADKVRCHQAEPSQHRQAPMLQLGLTEVWHQLSLLWQAQGVELIAAPSTISAWRRSECNMNAVWCMQANKQWPRSLYNIAYNLHKVNLCNHSRFKDWTS